MSVHEKIRFVRLAKGWTQEYLAEKLDMSVNGYGDLERGKNDIKLSKLEQISELLGVDLSELFDKKETNVFNNFGSVQTNQQNWCNIHQSLDYLQLKSEFEKSQLLNSEKNKEITLLKRIIELMEAKNKVSASTGLYD